MEQNKMQADKLHDTKIELNSIITESPVTIKKTAVSEIILENLVEEKLRTEWVKFWSKAKHSHAQQHLYYAEVEIAKGRRPIYFCGLMNGQIRAAGIFSIKPLYKNKYSFEAVCLRGPVFEDMETVREFMPQLIEKFGMLGVGSIRISPYWRFPEAEALETYLHQCGFKPFYPREGPRGYTGYIDLRVPEEQMYESLSKSAKKSVERMHKLGITFKDVTEFEDIEASYNCASAMRKKNGLSYLPKDEFRAVFKNVLRKQEIGLLTNAYKDGHMLGTLWSMRGPKVVNLMGYAIFHEITNQLVRRYTLGIMLWWHHILWAKSQGADFYDVEGYKAGAPNSEPLKKIWDFKEKLGVKEVCVLAEHFLICNRMVYLIYKAVQFGKKLRRLALSLPYQLQRRLCRDFSREAIQ